MIDRILLSIISMMLSVMSFAASAIADDANGLSEGFLTVRQKPGTERLLRQYMSSAKTKNDTVYALIYIPTYCKRCEVTIPVFYNQLKQLDSLQKMVLITAYRDSVAAKGYNERNGYEADAFIYDTNDSYEKFLEFNMNGLYGLFVLKICKSSGDLVLGSDMDELDLGHMKSLLTYNKAMPKKSFSDGGNMTNTYPEPQEPLVDTLRQVDYQLTMPQQCHLSNASNGLTANDSLLFFCDELTEGIMVFRRDASDGYVLKDTVTANDNEKNRFVNVPDDVFQSMVSTKQVFYIPIFPRLSTNQRWIDVSYSLPNITVAGRNGSNVSVAYFNKPVVIRRNAATLQPDSMHAVDSKVTTSDYMTQHFRFAECGDTMFFGCKKKTFPIECNREDYENIVAMNPFSDGFYDTPNPFVAAYSKRTGLLLKQFGHLDDCARKSKTGYAFVDVAMETDGNDFVYSDGYSGKIYVSPLTRLDSVAETYTLFQPETAKFPMADTATYYKEEYIKPFNRFFYRHIMRLHITSTNVYALVRYGMPMDTDKTTGHVFAQIDRRTGKTTMRQLPKYAAGELRSMGFMRHGDTFAPAVLLKKGGKALLRVYAE